MFYEGDDYNQSRGWFGNFEDHFEYDKAKFAFGYGPDIKYMLSKLDSEDRANLTAVFNDASEKGYEDKGYIARCVDAILLDIPDNLDADYEFYIIPLDKILGTCKVNPL